MHASQHIRGGQRTTFRRGVGFLFNHVGPKYQSQIKSGAFTQGAILQALRIYLQQMKTERSQLVDKLKHRAAAWSLRNTHIWNSSSSQVQQGFGGSVAKRVIILLTHLIMDSIYSLLKPFGFFSSNRDQDEVWYSTTLKSYL